MNSSIGTLAGMFSTMTSSLMLIAAFNTICLLTIQKFPTENELEKTLGWELLGTCRPFDPNGFS
jgi:hypothetical protein